MTVRPDYSSDIHHIIELAWRDEVSFDDIKSQTGLAEKQVIAIMRGHMKPSSFRMSCIPRRARVSEGSP